jgi:HSP20 family molecular chaperone IbpA
MATTDVVEVTNSETPEKTTEAILDELRLDLAEWMTADRDLVWRPAIELTKEDNEFAVRVLVPGLDPKDVEVLVAPKLLLIRGDTYRGNSGHRKLLRSIEFPVAVDPGKVHAELKDGMLSVKVDIANESKANISMPLAA